MLPSPLRTSPHVSARLPLLLPCNFNLQLSLSPRPSAFLYSHTFYVFLVSLPLSVPCKAGKMLLKILFFSLALIHEPGLVDFQVLKK